MTLSIAEKQTLYKYHNLNKKSLENAIDLIKLNIKENLRKECSDGNYVIQLPFRDKQRIQLLRNVRSYNRILFGLLVSWSDECIRRLYYEPNAFTDSQIDYLLTNKALEQKWLLALKIAFLKANGLIPAGNGNCRGITVNSRLSSSLTLDSINKYDSMKLLIKDFLIPSFNIRNKVQHGEWVFAFKPPHSKEYSRELTESIKSENIITISSRQIIFNSIYQLIVDLARFSSNNFKIDPSKTPFEYFYSQHIKKIEYEKSQIASADIEQYRDCLIKKREHGKQYKLVNKNIRAKNKLPWWKKVFEWLCLN